MAAFHSTNVQKLLDVLPKEWRGTTFDNSKLLGRELFAKGLGEVLAGGAAITTDQLVAIGNAEDYMRVATNVATAYEMFVAQQDGLDVSRVWSFSSAVMPIVAVCLAAAPAPVDAIVVDGAEVKKFDHVKALVAMFGCTLTKRATRAECGEGSVVLRVGSGGLAGGDEVDGTVADNVLRIANAAKIDPARILVFRKRMCTPLTTPVAVERLQAMAEAEVDGTSVPESPAGTFYKGFASSGPDTAAVAEFHAHLQTMCGTAVNPASRPVDCTAGLPTICALWMTLAEKQGGADVLMCSTAYGGSSQLTDLMEGCGKLNKHTFDLQGSANHIASVQAALDRMAADSAALAPTTVLFMEAPSNPDMKVPEWPGLVASLAGYRAATGKKVVMLIDTTLAPDCKMMEHLQKLDPELPVIVFISMSKSVSRGKTTAGTLVANHTADAIALIEEAAATAETLDLVAEPDQMALLCANHVGCEQRLRDAYEVAVAVGEGLRAAVQAKTNTDMPICFVTPETAQLGFWTSTFSFNLPAPANVDASAAMAQNFVDQLTARADLFKPCVSFGQDNGLVYATVPATSTQGAIKAEDKAKQAVGGVQLTRFSFPPTCDVSAVVETITNAVNAIYEQAQ